MENHINQIANIRDRLNKLQTEWHTTVETYKDHIPDEFFNCTQEYLECVRQIETQSSNLEGALRLASFHPYNLAQDAAGFFRRTFLKLRASPLVQAFSTLARSCIYVAIFILSFLFSDLIHHYAFPLIYFFISFIEICVLLSILTWVFVTQDAAGFFRRTFLRLRASPLVQAFPTLPLSYVHVALLLSILVSYLIYRYTIPLAYLFSSFIEICVEAALTWAFKAAVETELFRNPTCAGSFIATTIIFLMTKIFLEVVLYLAVSAGEFMFLCVLLYYVATQTMFNNG